MFKMSVTSFCQHYLKQENMLCVYKTKILLSKELKTLCQYDTVIIFHFDKTKWLKMYSIAL